MKTITKNQLIEKFQENKYIQLNFPEMDENEPIYMRSEIQTLDHMNTIYRDGNKLYLENCVDAINRLAKRLHIEVDFYNYDNLDYCLYDANYIFKDAIKKYESRYF